MFRILLAVLALTFCSSVSVAETQAPPSFTEEIDRVVDLLRMAATNEPPDKATSAALERHRAEQKEQLQKTADILIGEKKVIDVVVRDVQKTVSGPKGRFRIIGKIPRATEPAMTEAERKFLQDWNIEYRKQQNALAAERPKTDLMKKDLEVRRQMHADHKDSGMKRVKEMIEARLPQPELTLATNDETALAIKKDELIQVVADVTVCTPRVSQVNAAPTGAKADKQPEKLTIVRLSIEGKLVEIRPDPPASKQAAKN